MLFIKIYYANLETTIHQFYEKPLHITFNKQMQLFVFLL